MKRILALICVAVLLAVSSRTEAAPRRIRLTFDEQEALVELYDNATAESLVKMLPLTLDF
ncbi:MAG: cyclophilin-like fold protein [bacterium]|nr:cyclophilin-like fold protein [bacterium]